MPIVAKHVHISEYGPLIDKITQRITSWEARLLSYPGKGRGSNRALVDWDSLCQPKISRGLGVYTLKNWNVALLCKLLWGIAQKEDRLWVRWVVGFYLKGQDVWHVQAKITDSWLWKSLLKVR